MILYQDLKGQSKGAIALTNARLTVIKTKAGRLWKSTNYIRIVNPDRALLGEYRECVLFFRNGKEMEEWYLALKTATTLHIPGSAATQSTRRQHFMNIMRTAGYNWQSSSTSSVPRPASVSAIPSDFNSSSGSSASSHPHSGQGSPPTSSSIPTPLSQATHAFKSEDDLLGFGKEHGSSSKWVNLLAHRVFYFLNDDPGFVALVKKKIAAKLAKLKKPSMLKSLTLKGLSFGTKLPIVSNISVKSADPDGALRLDADMAYNGNATVELDLVIEPELFGTKITTIPATIKVIVKSIVGKIQLAFSPPPSDLMWMGFYTEPHIDLEFSSFVGEKHRLINIPQVTSIVVTKLKQEIVEMMLMPDMDDWPLPHLKLPKGVTRERYVVWEYQAGYTPPPQIKTEFDSSDSDIELESRASYEKPSSTTSASTTTSSSTKTFGSTFASSVEVPAVQMKSRATSTSSSSSSTPTPSSSSGSSSTGSKQSNKGKPLPPMPIHPPTLPPKPSTTTSAPATPVLGTMASSTAHHVPHSSSVSVPTPAFPNPGHISLPASLSHVPNLETSPNATSGPLTGTNLAPSRSTSSLPQAKSMALDEKPQLPVRVPYRPPSPPKVQVQSFRSDVIPSDTTEADAIFGPFDPLTGENVAPKRATSAKSPSPPSSSPSTSPTMEKTMIGHFVMMGEGGSDSSNSKPTTASPSPIPNPSYGTSASVKTAETSQPQQSEHIEKHPVVEVDPLLIQTPVAHHIAIPLDGEQTPILKASEEPEELHPQSPTTATSEAYTEADISDTDTNVSTTATIGTTAAADASEASSASTSTPEESYSSSNPRSSPFGSIEGSTSSQGSPNFSAESTGIAPEKIESVPETPNQPAAKPSVVPEPVTESVTVAEVHQTATSSAVAPAVVEETPLLKPDSSADDTPRSSLSAPEEVECGPLGTPSAESEENEEEKKRPPAPGASSAPGSVKIDISPPQSRERASSTSNSTATSPSSGQSRELSGHSIPASKAPVSLMDQKPPLPPRREAPKDPLQNIFGSSSSETGDYKASSTLSGRPVPASKLDSSGGADPFADIFTGADSSMSTSSTSHGFQSALQPPPQLPPRPKKKPETTQSSSAFPHDLYASDQPKSWSSGGSGSKKESGKSTSSSVKATFKSIFETIKDTAAKLDD
jgi:hypothetical protein